MKNIFVCTLACYSFFFAVNLYAAPIWNTSEITAIPSSGVNVDVMISSGPNADNVVGVWSDINTYAPYYSIYNNGTWSTGPISLTVSGGTDSVGVYDNVYVASGPNTGNLIAAWSDANLEVPYFSLYNNGTWTTGTIPLGTSDGAYFDIVLSPGPNTGEVTAVWTNLGSHQPYYSIYSGGVWSTNTISLGTSSGCASNVFISQGPTIGTLFATWADRTTGAPYYSIYSGGSWTTALIPLGSSTAVAHDVIVTLNSHDGTVAATWSDAVTSEIYYSIYNSGSWTTGSIPLGSSNGCFYNIFIAAEVTGELVATWSDSMTQNPFYSIYSAGLWSDGTVLPLDTSTGAHQNVGVANVSSTNTMIATWGNVPYPNLPYYSSFIGTPIPPPPPTPPPPTPPTPPAPIPSKLPPTNGKGIQIKNQFATQVLKYNFLKWTASSSPHVKGYNIRRNGTLITQDLKETTYKDHYFSNKKTVYKITTLFNDGSESLNGLEIVIK